MTIPCCEKSYEKTRRPCPRCSKPICHHCGVIARGTLMCGDCSVRPPGEDDPEAVGGKRDLARLAAVGVAAFAGGIAGAGAWAIAGALSGGFSAWGALLPGTGARIGVLIAGRDQARSFWVIKALAALAGVFAGFWFNAFYEVGALYARGAAAIPAHVREIFGNEPPTSLLDWRVMAMVLATFVANGGAVAASAAIALAAALLGRWKR